MIQFNEVEHSFHIFTEQTSYVLAVLKSGHLGHFFYGDRISTEISLDTLRTAFDIEVGNQVIYNESDTTFNLNLAMLEFSTYGKGDFRDPMCHFRFSDGSRISDFRYKSHEILKEKPKFSQLPESHITSGKNDDTLKITLEDLKREIEIDLYYTAFFENNLITRRIIIRNLSTEPILVEKASSLNLDIIDKNYHMISFDGAWIRERMITKHQIEYGILKIDSKKGVSSNDHNPSFILLEENTTEEHGKCYGFSLIYSGDFETTVEKTPHQLIRILFGINSFDFYYTLKPNESFVTPEVVMNYSGNGLNQLSQQFHEFVKKNIIHPKWDGYIRPVVLNNWEATYFDFTEKKIISLAKSAKKLGIEMFVLDDGWFSKRNDDHSSLGDWYENKKKLPHGLNGLAKKINNIGLAFGLWVEPEMISVDSDLYRTHPNWAIKHPNYNPSFGRNQLILDLTNKEVIDYLFITLENLFSSANIQYVKWDMNRNFSDKYSDFLAPENQGALNYLYYVGLYQLLDSLTKRFPDILFESCASGGNRFDLGMLQYMPQTWTSDNTDALSRELIQYSTSYIYPLSAISNHVSEIPNQQTLRQVPLETRFNVAMFGILGYELDLTMLTVFEKKVIKKQIEFYKLHRDLLQFGKFSRHLSPYDTNQYSCSVVNSEQSKCITGIYQKSAKANEKLERFYTTQLDTSSIYRINNRDQYFNLSEFGHLIHHALPIRLNANKIVFHILKNRYLMKVETYDKLIPGDIINVHGFTPYQPFIGSGYHDKVRLMGDYGSRVYLFSKIKEE